MGVGFSGLVLVLVGQRGGGSREYLVRALLSSMVDTNLLKTRLWREDFETHLMIAVSAIWNANMMARIFLTKW